MDAWRSRLDNLYRLVVDAERSGDPRIIDFEASGAQSALVVAGRHCRGRQAEVFENGRALCRIVNDATDGFWVIMPPVPPRGAATARQAR